MPNDHGHLANMDIYDRLGVTRLINAQTRASKIGGSLMHEDVLRAMSQAASSFVDMSQLLRQASEHIARLIGVEAALIVNSAAAGLTVMTAACVAGSDPDKIYRLPDTHGMKNEVIVHRMQRNHYDCCVRQAGVRFVEIGSSRDTHAWELETAITEKTAAVVYFISHIGRFSLKLADVIHIAHARGVPVIVDAESELPPVSNLSAFLDEGADLVIFSGGKGIAGPQASGLILGRPEMIARCALNAFPNQNAGHIEGRAGHSRALHRRHAGGAGAASGGRCRGPGLNCGTMRSRRCCWPRRPGTIHPRHSCASRNPLAAPCWSWIPACAGMTGEGGRFGGRDGPALTSPP